MRRIASRHNPIVAAFRAAARGGADAPMLLDGPHLVGEALDARVTITLAAVSAEAASRPDAGDLIRRLEDRRIEVVSATAPVMNALTPVRSPSGVVALAERPRIDPAALYPGGVPLLVVAADVQDPGNLGAIVRVAEAGGATGVIVAGASADPYGWKALRGSMGSALRLPLAVAKTSNPIEEPRRRGCRIVAAIPRAGRPMAEVDFTTPTAIVIGGEGHGLDATTIDAADERVTIPMHPPVESLNAAVTAALLIYEARRQRATHAAPAASATVSHR